MQDRSLSTAESHSPEQHSIFAVWRWKPWKFRLIIGVLLVGYILAPTPVVWGMYAYGWTRWDTKQWKRAMITYDLAFFPLRLARFHSEWIGIFYQQQMLIMCNVFGSPVPPERGQRIPIPNGLF